MSRPEAPSPVDLPVTEPFAHDPTAIAENTFLRRGVPAMADERSTEQYAAYAVERAYGADSDVARQYAKHGSRMAPQWDRDGWLISPRWAVAGTVLVTALANTGVLDGVKVDDKPVGRIIPDAAGKVISEARDAVVDAFTLPDPTNSPVKTTSENQGTPAIVLPAEKFKAHIYGSEQPSGKVTINAADLRSVDTRLKEAKRNGEHLDSAKVEGQSSDEWLPRGQRSLGVADPGNFSLARQRAAAGVKALKKVLKRNHVSDPGIQVEAQEKIIPRDTAKAEAIGSVLVDVNKYGYNSITSAFLAYERGDKMPASLRRNLREITRDRSTIIELNFSTKAKTIPGTPAEKPAESSDDHNKGPIKLPFEFIPLFPIPRWRRSKRDLFAKLPRVKDEVPEKIKFQLFKEAAHGIGRELVGDAWAHTRKYLLLMRDDRIKKLSRYDFTDAEGKNRSFRVGFVDHEPTEETLDAIEDIMKKMSYLRGGKVTDRLNMVMVFPTENTGRQHPKKIGLGIDEQYDRRVQGLAIPALNLVELHMPTNPTEDDLKGFDSMSWTMAHEIGGHFTDVVEEPTRLIQNRGGGRARRNFRTSNVWAHVGVNGYNMVGTRGSVSISGRQFAIKAPTEGPQPPTGELIVTADDNRLRKASFVRLRGLNPTPYGDTNHAESYAETAAQVITEAPIPFKQAGVKVKRARVEGYHVDAGLLFNFATRVGSLRNVEGLAWRPKDVARIEESWKRYDLNPNQDQQFNRNSEHAKNTRYQGPKQRLRIVTGAKG